MKYLSHVVFAADITRAATSKTAKELMGEHFRRQMQYDGQLRNLSFVATKSDAIGSREELEKYEHSYWWFCAHIILNLIV